MQHQCMSESTIPQINPAKLPTSARCLNGTTERLSSVTKGQNWYPARSCGQKPYRQSAFYSFSM